MRSSRGDRGGNHGNLPSAATPPLHLQQEHLLLGSRVAAAELRTGFQLSITNVPGPQAPLFTAGARMVSTYPVPPLLPGQTLAIGVTSYDGQVTYGITADRDLVPDADVLGLCVREALDELLDTAGARRKVARGRRRARQRDPGKQGRS